MKTGKVIAYASRKHKLHEKNYPTYDLELATIMFALNILRHNLFSVHVDVFTDQQSFQYLFEKNDLNLRQKRFLELLMDYEMSVLYHPNKENVVADALSRLSIASVAHIKDRKKDLFQDVHRLVGLDVQLFDSSKDVVMVSNNLLCRS
ncbi:hypothetical protein MTR67_023187 [Solanum verrucosum]|uniref:Reverse transcriptase RNase H-like domain-containing protein n=1 Tax=Solanum verrucosum TaxID=315347 RepID=A0AAF0QT18_SOLVR|nr:hypothetical protein MTR67_023187 [Solanum verrucosum]